MKNNNLVGYQYRETDDIYGNGPDKQKEIFEMLDKAYKSKLVVSTVNVPDWFSPMMMDEQYVPGTGKIKDYGGLPDLDSDRELSRQLSRNDIL